MTEKPKKGVKIMEATRNRREGAEKRVRQQLRQHIGLGRTALLVLLVVSLLNQLMLLLKINYHFLFSAAVPYYLNWMALKLGEHEGVTFFKVFALLATLAIFAVYVGCWMFSARQRRFLKLGLVIYCADTVLLVIFAFALLNNPFSCLLEILTHLVGIALLYDSHRCAQQLARMSKKRRRERPVAEGERYE